MEPDTKSAARIELPPNRKLVATSIRLPLWLVDHLKVQSKRNYRSLAAEIKARLADSVGESNLPREGE